MNRLEWGRRCTATLHRKVHTTCSVQVELRWLDVLVWACFLHCSPNFDNFERTKRKIKSNIWVIYARKMDKKYFFSFIFSIESKFDFLFYNITFWNWRYRTVISFVLFGHTLKWKFQNWWPEIWMWAIKTSHIFALVSQMFLVVNCWLSHLQSEQSRCLGTHVSINYKVILTPW